MQYISYLRVSTENQSRSGLGLDAQKSMIRSFINKDDIILKEYIEAESGKNNNRPMLNQAIADSKQFNATLLIAKLDRLSRNAAFIFKLRDSEVNFRAVDMPDANSLTVGIMAVLAQHERELISDRTRKAMQVKKLRGDRMGNPQNLTDYTRERSLAVRQRNALNHPANKQAMEMIFALRQSNLTFQQIADKLSVMGMKTRNNKDFVASTVRRLYKIKERLESESV
ncbi:Resolvase, N terminal domain [Reichenbachiella faecimaris]|uniref:Resolvase, N terminal domain n=1 Tax=Reichenbachiella faecimaris TaxID=692418 RepID=A0A1W2GHX9_REIFA|nr:recombinase family protein [Reichenbachiella faecimaris]SMD36082.1 Resolvase, N terminal domain [Reichenbachiella faecimaris]